MFEPLLPDLRTPIPGPRSRALAARLQRVECPETTAIGDDFPIFWERARGANVWDADGNRFVDLTGAFGVALLGHGHPAVVAAIRAQAETLVHGMGDVHPSALKVQLGEALAAVAPGDLEVSLFGCTGSDAIEAALKTAVIATGRAGVLAFEGAYHGLAHGALAATHRSDFRAPFQAALNPHVRFLPYPALGGRRDAEAVSEAATWRVLESVDAHLASPSGENCGAVLVEPIQGRAGIVLPHPDFLPGLRDICTRRGALLIADEILTGLGRTGRWFDCERTGVLPDLLCVGKGLAGGLPLSAAIGSRAIMDTWGPSTGEARHTSTFLGNPLACAAALATLEALGREDGPGAAVQLGQGLAAALAPLTALPGVHDVRGIGSMWGIELVAPGGAPDAARAFEVVRRSLQRGVLLLADGSERNVLALLPPLALAAAQMAAAVEVLRQVLLETAPRGSA